MGDIMWSPCEMSMTSALVLTALVGVIAWSLMSTSRSVDVNRGIATQSLTALLMGPSLRPQLGRLLGRLSRDVAPPRWAASSAGGER